MTQELDPSTQRALASISGQPRPHLGYRNQGRRPWETVERFVSQSSARQGG